MNEQKDSMWRWNETEQCFVTDKTVCDVKGFKYKPQKYDRIKGLIDLS